MNTKIKSMLIVLLAILVFQSCEDEKDYTLKVYNPKGGIINPDSTITTNQYLDKTIQDVKLGFIVERLNGKTAEYSLSVESVEPASLSNAFTLTSNQVSLSKKSDTLSIGKIDWSKLPAGGSVKVNIVCKGSEATDINYNGQSIAISFAKTAAPVFELGNADMDFSFPLGESGTFNQSISIEMLDKPLEEDIDIALKLYPEGLTRGVDFEIDTLIHIASGKTEGIVNLTVDGNKFIEGQQVEIYLETAAVPDGKTLTLGSKNWVGFIIGKAADRIFLDKSKTYTALMDKDYQGNQKITLTIPMLSSPAIQDIAMPIRLNEYYLQENTHFIIPEKVARIAKGEKECKLDIYVIGNAFTPGVSNSLWLELHKEDIPAGQAIIVDGTNWWTTIEIGRKN